MSHLLLTAFILILFALAVTLQTWWGMCVLIHSQLATSSFIRPLSNSVSRLNWSIVSVSCLMIASLSTVLLEDYYSNNIEVLWSRMGFRSIWKNSVMGGYVEELNTYILFTIHSSREDIY